MNIISEIGRPSNKTRVDYYNGSNSDIIKTIHHNFNAAVNEAAPVAEKFRGKNNLETAKNIWFLLRNKVRYKVDPGGLQQIKLPKRFLSLGVGDCKSFSLFTAGVLANLGMPVKFRYASYSSSPTPGHVYIVTEDEQGNDIIIDGVWYRFNDEKNPTYKPIDYNMRIETLSGTDPVGKIKLFKKLKDLLPKVGQIVSKANPLFIVGRQAFLGLVRLNVRSFASRLADSIAKNESNAKTVWTQKLGGDYGALVSAVNAGKTKKAIFPKKIGDIVEMAGIGDPATIAAITAAAPVILVVINSILKATGHGNDPVIDETVAEANEKLDEDIDVDELNDLSKKGLQTKQGSFFDLDLTPIGVLNIVIKAAVIITGLLNLI